MKFQVLDILPNIENPVTGRLVSTAERFAQALQSARRAEELGFDAVALVGNNGLTRRNPLERHLRDVLCSRVHTPQDDSIVAAAG